MRRPCQLPLLLLQLPEELKQNRLTITAILRSKEPLRYSPAGVPILNCRLVHQSEQIEAGLIRSVTCEIPAVAVGDIAARLESMEARVQRHAGTPKAPRAERELRAAKATVEGSRRLVFTNSAGGAWAQGLCRRLKPCLRAARRNDETPFFDEARIAEVDVHTLRHTFGSQLFAEGFDIKTVQELLGHASAITTADVYAHGFADRKREAVEALKLGIDKNDAALANKPHAVRA